MKIEELAKQVKEENTVELTDFQKAYIKGYNDGLEYALRQVEKYKVKYKVK